MTLDDTLPNFHSGKKWVPPQEGRIEIAFERRATGRPAPRVSWGVTVAIDCVRKKRRDLRPLPT